MSSSINTEMEPNEYWMDLVTEMLWVIERDLKFTLKGINDDFKQLTLSFDVDFRNNFLQIIQQRVSNTYDQFVMNLEFEEQRAGFDTDAMDCGVFSSEQLQITNRLHSGHNRKKDDSDISNQVFLIKRPKRDEGVMMNEEYKSESEAGDLGSEPDEDDAIVESNIAKVDDDEECTPTMSQSTIYTERDVTNEQAKTLSRKEEEPAKLISIATNAASKSIVETESEVSIDVDNIADAVPQTSKFPSNKTSKADTRTNPTIEREVKTNDHQPKLPLALRPAPASVKKIRMRELKKTDTKIELSTTKSASTGDNSSKGASNEKSNEQRPPKKSICNKRKRLMHKCDQCDYQSDHKGHFTRHIEMHQKKPFRCERCRKSLADQELFDIHMKGHENQCTKCLSVFGNKLAMKEHEKHCNRRNYQCYLCKYTTVKRTDFMAHMSTHTGNRPFKCQHCKADFTTNSHLKRHKKNVHKLS